VRLPFASSAKLTPPWVAIWLSGLIVEAVVPEPCPAQENRSFERVLLVI
jgi:hypothetical protein